MDKKRCYKVWFDNKHMIRVWAFDENDARAKASVELGFLCRSGTITRIDKITFGYTQDINVF